MAVGGDATVRELGLPRRAAPPTDFLWAMPEAEYPGAVSFLPSSDTVPRYETVDERDIGRRLRRVQAMEGRNGIGAPEPNSGRPVSLSGMRGKIGIRLPESESRPARIPLGNALSTHIVKVEDRSDGAAGEAGIECIAQRTLANLGIPAACTRARVFDGVQAVVSARFDRIVNSNTGRVESVHQEDFCQAAGASPDERFDYQWGKPEWPELHRILRRHATGGDAVGQALIRVLASAALIGHTDLHRKNIALVHSPREEAPAVDIAPMYDVSCCDGRHGYTTRLAVGICGEHRLEAVDEKLWRKYAAETDSDPAEVWGIARDVAARMPDALADAIERSRTEDEIKDRSSVERRVELMQQNVSERSDRWSSVKTL